MGRRVLDGYGASGSLRDGASGSSTRYGASGGASSDRGDAPSEDLLRLRERAVRSGPAALSHHERARLAADADSMRWLHREAWRHWPVESWQLASALQLPPF